jgi:hypothetical protein
MKWFLIVLALASISLFAVGQSTWVDSYWTGSGNFDTHFHAGDDFQADLWTGGAAIAGEFHGKDAGDNPYTYGVDTCYAWADATVAGGGFIDFYTEKLDNAGAYGPPGQWQISQVWTSDGNAGLGYYSWGNYAEMANCQFGTTQYGKTSAGVFGPYTTGKPRSPAGVSFEADSSSTGSYWINHEIHDADGDLGRVFAAGTGSAEVWLMGEKARQYFNMGYLPICGDGCAWYGNYATFTGTSTGPTNDFFNVYGEANNQIDAGCCGTPVVPTIPGGGTQATQAVYNLGVNYWGTWNYIDFGVTGN